MALPDHLQLHRCLPARDQHHPRHPRGLGRDRGAPGLKLLVRADGAARGNPGPAAAGAVLIDPTRDDAPVAVVARPLGIQTNNYAEYMAVVLALRRARELGAQEVEIVLDSKLVVEQLAGRWKVRHPQIAPLVAQARTELAAFRRWSIRHEPRAANAAADALANLALDDPMAAAAAEREGQARAVDSGGDNHALPWAEFAARSPALAEAGHRLIRAFTVGYLATLRADGAPRVHPVSVTLHEGGLYIFVIAGSRRADDLRRDPRYALHTFPRPPSDDAWDDEEFEVEGRAVEVTDPKAQRRLREVHTDSAGAGDRCYELRVERAHWKSRRAGRPIVRHWPPG